MDFIEKFYHTDIDGAEVGDLRLVWCGRRLNAPDHRFGPAARENYWLIYIGEGTGVYRTDKAVCRVGRGDVMAAFPNRRIFYQADPGSVWSIWWVSIAAEPLGCLLPLTGLKEDHPVLHAESPQSVESVFEALLAEAASENANAKFTCMSLLYKLLALLTPAGPEAAPRDYIDEAIFFMTSGYAGEITPSDIAGRLNLDRSYFSRLFRRRIGISPSEWLLRYRLGKAAALLRSTDLKIKEIALSVGFSDPLYFTRRFTSLCGVTPSAYREDAVQTSDPIGTDVRPDSDIFSS